ncbi:unnamed protein product [Durusdinium trenchii]|uniref:Uncharacterized protein n=1 Tax=Durusdinium trenchii TaxID=1381693 RepID=A0ABP0LSC1_9DINO
MGHSPEEVREQVLRCLKQRKQQAKVVQESLRKRSKYEMITAAEVDRVEKLAKEIGDVDAMKAAYLNDQEKIKAALVKRKEQMDRQIRRLDQDGQDHKDKMFAGGFGNLAWWRLLALLQASSCKR